MEDCVIKKHWIFNSCYAIVNGYMYKEPVLRIFDYKNGKHDVLFISPLNNFKSKGLKTSTFIILTKRVIYEWHKTTENSAIIEIKDYSSDKYIFLFLNNHEDLNRGMDFESFISTLQFLSETPN